MVAPAPTPTLPDRPGLADQRQSGRDVPDLRPGVEPEVQATRRHIGHLHRDTAQHARVAGRLPVFAALPVEAAKGARHRRQSHGTSPGEQHSVDRLDRTHGLEEHAEVGARSGAIVVDAGGRLALEEQRRAARRTARVREVSGLDARHIGDGPVRCAQGRPVRFAQGRPARR